MAWWERLGEATFVFRHDEFGVVLRLRNVRQDDGHTYGDLYGFIVPPDEPWQERRFIVRPHVNMTSDRGIPALVRTLTDAARHSPAESYDWLPILNRICGVLVEEMDRKGVVNVLKPLRGGDLAQPMAFRDFLPAELVSGLIAHGGTGKSLTGSMLAVATATGKPVGPFVPLISGPVLYLDWENDRKLHERRISRIFIGLGYDLDGEDFPGASIVHYQARSKLLASESDIMELAHEVKPALTIADSIGFAAGGNLNDSDIATAAVNILKHLPGTKVMIAHVSKATLDGLAPKGSGPIGSAFFWNGPQAVYDLRATEPDLFGNVILTIHHNKANVGRKLVRPMGCHVAFDDPDGPITPTEHRVEGDSPEGAGMTLSVRISDVLGRGSGTVGQIAEALGFEGKGEIETLGRVLRRMKERGEVVATGDARSGQNPLRYGLAARGEEPFRTGRTASGQATDSPRTDVPPCAVCGKRDENFAYDDKERPVCGAHMGD